MLVASYAAVHRLEVVIHAADRDRFPLDADERRDLATVAEADAAVILWDGADPGVRRVRELVERKGIPVHVVAGPETGGKVRARRSGW